MTQVIAKFHQLRRDTVLPGAINDSITEKTAATAFKLAGLYTLDSAAILQDNKDFKNLAVEAALAKNAEARLAAGPPPVLEDEKRLDDLLRIERQQKTKGRGGQRFFPAGAVITDDEVMQSLRKMHVPDVPERVVTADGGESGLAANNEAKAEQKAVRPVRGWPW